MCRVHRSLCARWGHWHSVSTDVCAHQAPTCSPTRHPSESIQRRTMTRIVIIGGGPAGYEAALVASQYGATVSLIDSDGIGGACVLFDCVPSKTFIASTGVRTDMRRARDLGITLDPSQATVSLPEVHSRVQALALAQSSDIRPNLQTVGVT